MAFLRANAMLYKLYICVLQIFTIVKLLIFHKASYGKFVFSILADQDRVWTPDVNNVVDEDSGSKTFAVNQPFVCYIES